MNAITRRRGLAPTAFYIVNIQELAHDLDYFTCLALLSFTDEQDFHQFMVNYCASEVLQCPNADELYGLWLTWREALAERLLSLALFMRAMTA